ncbi:MAG: UDP-N-acetylglucosamine 1-carboxyvinyltransferase [Bacteriovoracales bacterium]|nr:UDP-N-acetylglucosamine 1-carboxyvinyltransferase [Bacteriovoracales bacterium]
MDKLLVEGGRSLSGKVHISVSKNSSLPIMAATLLGEGKTVLKDLPVLRDIQTFKQLLTNLGGVIETKGRETLMESSSLKTFFAVYDIVKTMRASILVLGPLVARYGMGKVSLPGGCAIGTRPIDLHLEGLEKLGARVSLEAGHVLAKASRLRGNRIALPFPSVGATENVMMASSLAHGESVIENAAREPEIVDLADFINAMGGKIEGAGTSTISIQGVETLTGCSYRPIPDRIEAATYLLAALTCRSSIEVAGCIPDHILSLLEILEGLGCRFDRGENSIRIQKPVGGWEHFDSAHGVSKIIETGPYPSFPTDIQAQLMAFLTSIKGRFSIVETIFENRFMHVAELRRLGAHITLRGNRAVIEGGGELWAAPVMCTDLRASAALVLAALRAKGRSDILRVYHLDRGYERIEEKLRGLGASVERGEGPTV